MLKEFSKATGVVEPPSTQAVEFTSGGQANYNYAGSRFSFSWQRADSLITVGKSQYKIRLIDESVMILEGQDSKVSGTTYAYLRKEAVNEKSPVIDAYFSGLNPQPPPDKPAPSTTVPEKKASITPTQNPLNDQEEPIYKVVDVQPSFPGCEDIDDEVKRKKCTDKEWLDFIYGNLNYPLLARENGVEGMVVVTYIVEKDGTITNAKIVRDIGAGCGEEAMRVINLMPKWNPGILAGQPVRVQFNFPVKFKKN